MHLSCAHEDLVCRTWLGLQERSMGSPLSHPEPLKTSNMLQFTVKPQEILGIISSMF